MWDKDANIGSIIQVEAKATDQKNKKEQPFKATLLFINLKYSVYAIVICFTATGCTSFFGSVTSSIPFSNAALI